jgi:MFS family permease
MNKPKLWTKDFLILNATACFVMLTFFVLVVIISVFAIDNFHSSPSEAGLASGIFVVSSFISRLFTGKWIERIGRRKMLYAGLIGGLIMSLLYFAVTGIVFLLVVRFLHGAAFGIATTAALTITSDIIPIERRGEGIGYSALASTLASAIGPFLGMFISRRWGFQAAFVICSVSAALSLALAFFLTVSDVELTKEQAREMKGFHLRTFFEPGAIPVSFVCSVAYFCYSGVLAFLAPYAREIQLSDVASFFFVVYSAATLLSRPYAGRLLDSKGENCVMYPAFLAFALALIVLGKASHGYTLLAAGAFMGFGLGAIQSASLTIAVKVAPSHRLGLANSTFFMFLDVAVGIGPFINGLFVPFSGYRGLYMGLTVLALACLLLYYLLHGRRAARSRATNA